MNMADGRGVRTARLVFLGEDCELTALRLFEQDIDFRAGQVIVGTVYHIFGLKVKLNKGENILTLPASGKLRCVIKQ